MECRLCDLQTVWSVDFMLSRLCGLQTVSYHNRQLLKFWYRKPLFGLFISHRPIAVENLLPRPFYEIKHSDNYPCQKHS